MNVLVLEDRGSVAHYMRDALEENGHVVLDAVGINDAKSHFRNETVDCIIADLNMSPSGLNPQEIEETGDGLLTGWIWLRDYVYKEDPSMKRRTIILSEYTYALEIVPAEDLSGIRQVDKKGSVSPADKVLRYVQDIARGLEGENR